MISSSPQTNTAPIIDADQFDPITTNNTASATATPQQADLVVRNTVSNATPNVGNTITFVIQVLNQGPNAATNVIVNDALPAGLTFVGATTTQGTYNSGAGVWTVGAVAPAAIATLRIQARVVSPQAQTNTANIASADQFDPNTGNNSASATETPQQSDLAVTKSVSNAAPNVGDTITYTITLTNESPNPATNVTLLDRLPAGMAFVSATPSQGTYSSATGIWTVGTVSPSAPQTLLLRARVVGSGTTTNTAVAHADQFDPDLSDNQASVTATPQHADLYLAKTVDNPRPLVGSTIAYTVTLTNLGPDEATNVVVKDLLPAGMTFVSASPSQGTYVSTTGVWTVGTVAPEFPQTLTLRATVTVATPLVNTVKVTHSDQFDPDPVNSAAAAAVAPRIPKADLVLTKTVNQSQVFLGTEVTYTFIIRNFGPDVATGVVVTDPFPPGLVFVSAATPTQGTYDPVHNTWNVGTLVNGAGATLKVTVRVKATGLIVTLASASAVELDPVLFNNFAVAKLIGLAPASIISKRMFLASRM